MIRQTTNNTRAENAPISPTNDWLSHKFFKAKNEEELKLQRDASKYLKEHPAAEQGVQLENIYRQLAWLTHVIQDSQRKKVPEGLRTYTITLNLLGSAEVQNITMDQILPANPYREEVYIYATQESALISHDSNPAILPVTNTGPLVTVNYAGINVNQDQRIKSQAAIYGISNSNSTNAILTIIETFYIVPRKLEEQFQLAKEEEHNIVHKNPLEEADLA